MMLSAVKKSKLKLNEVISVADNTSKWGNVLGTTGTYLVRHGTGGPGCEAPRPLEKF